jgi:class 3 adenylate cyclase
MSGLPSGTVTFLFTDIEGSTQRWQQQPAAMGPALARHDRLVREAIEAHGGVVFKTVGDAFCAAFADPSAALAAALTAQRALYGEPWGTTGPLRVRMALHTGRAEVQGGDYVGAPLNRVARLLSAGHGGQVLVSGATAELVQDHLPQEVHLRDLGTHQLKDLYRPERLFQVVTPDLPADFSPVVTTAHLPPYPGDEPPAAAASPPAGSVRPGRRRAVAVAGGLVLVLVLAGTYVFRGGGTGPEATQIPAVAATTPTVGPTPEGSGVWGLIATPPPAPAFVVFGVLDFDAGWKGDARSLPGPMLLYVADQPEPPTVWVGGAATLMRNVVPGTPAVAEPVVAGTYVDLHPHDQMVVPANTPFAVQTGQHVAVLAALIAFPGGPPTAAPDASFWEWWSWGTVETWPPGPVEVRFDDVFLAPGESKALPEQGFPQLVYVDASTSIGVGLMLAAGGGETTASYGFEGGQAIDLDAAPASPPEAAGTPGRNGSLSGSREPITPGVEATLGGTIVGKAAFLDPGSSGTLRNPGEAQDTVEIVVVTFAPAGTSG